MAISYVKRPTQTDSPTRKSTTHGFPAKGASTPCPPAHDPVWDSTSVPIREVPIPRIETLRQLRYYTDAYNRLTAEIATANLLNNDKWRKETIKVSQLYRLRANAAAQMAIYSDAILSVHGY